MGDLPTVKKAVIYYYEGETLIVSKNALDLAYDIEVYDGTKREGPSSFFSISKDDFKVFYEEVIKL